MVTSTRVVDDRGAIGEPSITVRSKDALTSSSVACISSLSITLHGDDDDDGDYDDGDDGDYDDGNGDDYDKVDVLEVLPIDVDTNPGSNNKVICK